MKNIHSNPTPLRQKFIEYLTLNRKAERTVHCYVSFIHALAKHCRRSPELLSHDDIQHWLYHLIAARKQAPSTVNLAINAVRSFYGKMLQQDIEPLLHRIKRPRRPARAPRVYSMAEVEKLLTLGTEGNLRARAFLSCVYGGGLRLSEATHIRIKDLDGARHRLLVSHPKGGRQRYTLLSENLLAVLYWGDDLESAQPDGAFTKVTFTDGRQGWVKGGLAATKTAGIAPRVPASPTPLTPSGLRSVRVVFWASSNWQKSSARGMQ